MATGYTRGDSRIMRRFLIYVLFILTTSKGGHTGGVAERVRIRQSSASCDTVCAFLNPLTSCQANDLQCECAIVDTGSITNCSKCVSTFNLTLAEQILNLGTECLTVSVTLAPSPTQFTSSVSPAQCTSACESYDNYVTCADQDWRCICPPIVEFGPICSYCALNPTAAAAAGSLINECSVLSVDGFPAYNTTRTGVPSQVIVTPAPSTSSSESISIALTATKTSAAAGEKVGELRAYLTGWQGLSLAVTYLGYIFIS
jgi:hypothetical protein